MSTAARRFRGARSPSGPVRDAIVTTGPIAGSAKCYRDLLEVPGGRVPFRRVQLSDGGHLDLYDTSGPYPDAGANVKTVQSQLGHKNGDDDTRSARAPVLRRPR